MLTKNFLLRCKIRKIQCLFVFSWHSRILTMSPQIHHIIFLIWHIILWLLGRKHDTRWRCHSHVRQFKKTKWAQFPWIIWTTTKVVPFKSHFEKSKAITIIIFIRNRIDYFSQVVVFFLWWYFANCGFLTLGIFRTIIAINYLFDVIFQSSIH